jgi:small subunit ribosomal protein S3
VIGRKGSEIERMTEDIGRMNGGRSVKIDIQEIKTPELDAQLVAENVATQLERRISFRRAMKKTIQSSMDFGAIGIKIRCAGRLGGAEISRSEVFREGKIPLHTLRAPIDYGFFEARTMYGQIGVKVWLWRPTESAAQPTQQRPDRDRGDRRDRSDRGGEGAGSDRSSSVASSGA